MIKILKKIWYLIRQSWLTLYVLIFYFPKIKKIEKVRDININQIIKILKNRKINKLWKKFLRKQKNIYFEKNAGGVNIKDQKLFFFLISFYKPEKILEIGTHLGHSLNVMACAKSYNNLDRTVIDTVDIYNVNESNRYIKNNKIFSPKNLLKVNNAFKNVNFLTNGSDIFFKNNKTKYDLIFIDGNHTINQTLKDVINSLNYLNKNGIIVIHDYYDIYNLKDVFNKIYGPFFAIKIIKNKIKNLKILRLNKIGNFFKDNTSLIILNLR